MMLCLLKIMPFFAFAIAITSASFNGVEPIYVENFDGSLKDWTIEVVSNPFNNELQYYTAREDNVRTDCGKLVITPIREEFGGRQYTSGRLFSDFYWRYGRVEVRAKLPNGFGLWPAIWMLPEFEVYGGWPQSGEIDILEARGQFNDQIATALHYGGVCCDQHFSESSLFQTQCKNDRFHVYSLDWFPTHMIFRLDGNPYYERRTDRIFQPDYTEPGQPFDQHFHLLLNVAIGGGFLDNPTENTTWDYPDAEMIVDYVKVYKLQDIADYSCAMAVGADPGSVCDSLSWACSSANTFANVSEACTDEMFECCSDFASCLPATLFRVATAVFSLHDSIVNDSNSCNFDGTAERRWYLLNEGKDGSQNIEIAQCLIKEDAAVANICGAMRWACLLQDYANVSSACAPWNHILTCCDNDPASCDEAEVRFSAQLVFQAYYDELPTPTSCYFDGIAFLLNPVEPVACTNGYPG